MTSYDLNRNLIYTGTVIGIVIVGLNLFLSFKSFRSDNSKEEGFSYEMARSKDFSPEFNLDGRDIAYDQEIYWDSSAEDELQSVNDSKNKNPNSSATPVNKSANSKSQLAKSKKADSKSKKDSKKVKIDTTDTSKAYSLNTKGKSFDDDLNKDKKSIEDEDADIITDTNRLNKKPQKIVSEELEQLSFQQWRGLLHADPSSKNAYNFVKAYRNGDINPKEFYQLASEFVADSSENKQTLGVYFYGIEHSLTNFTELVMQIQKNHSNNLVQKISINLNTILNSYLDTKYFSILNQAMMSLEKAVATAALSFVRQAIAKAANSTTGSTGSSANISLGENIARQTRNTAEASLNSLDKKSVLIFESSLKALAASSGGPYQSLAQNLLQFLNQIKS